MREEKSWISGRLVPNKGLKGKEENMFHEWQVGFPVMLTKVIHIDPVTMLG